MENSLDVINVSRKDIVLGYISQFLNVGSGLILLPLVVIFFDAEEASLWFLIMTIVSSIVLIDFGFSHTISRNFSYIISGVSELKKEGVAKNEGNNKINYILFFDLLKVTKRIYLFLGFVCFLFLMIFGSWYIYHIVRGTDLVVFDAMTAWTIYVVSMTMNISFLYFVPALMGCGKIKEGYIANIIGKGILIVFSIFSVFLGYGIIGLSVSYCASVIVSRIYSRRLFYTQSYFTSYQRFKNISLNKKLLSILWHNSSKLGLVGLGAFLINKSTILLAGAFLSIEEAGSYALTMQIFSVFMMVSQTYFQMHVPIFSSLQTTNNKVELRDKYYRCIFYSMLMMTVLSIGFIVFGEWGLSLIKSNLPLLSPSLLILASLMLFLEMHHSLAATLIATANNIPFVKSAMVSGFGVVILAYILLDFFSLGVLGLLLAQFFIQIIYNNWKWPVVAWNMIR